MVLVTEHENDRSQHIGKATPRSFSFGKGTPFGICTHFLSLDSFSIIQIKEMVQANLEAINTFT